jgi:ligand-binding sensor domain-containing protein
LLVGALLLVFQAVAAGSAETLDLRRRLTEYAQQNWQLADGLPQNSVFAIIQSRDGYLWLATQAGLVRFDGVRFQVFGRANTPEFERENVAALAEDGDGAIWVGTTSGVRRYLRGRFTRYDKGAGLPSERIRCLALDNGGLLWVSTDAGVCVLKHGAVLPPGVLAGTEASRVNRIRPAGDGRMWFATTHGLVRYSRGRIERFGTEQGLPSNARTRGVRPWF